MTSIKWLDEQIQEHIISQDLIAQNLIIKISISDYFEIKKKAKEMHKKEIIDAFDEGQEYEYQYHINSTPKFDSETYYNETFKKD